MRAAGSPADRIAPASSVDEVVDLYRRWASDPYDEDVSQLDHALQTAALAAADGADDDLVVAALLHDVGHLIDLALSDGSGPAPTDLGHEGVGARYLAALFPASVIGPIALHVRAKRYRCAVDPEYHATLSDGSRRSLALQGGPYDAAGVASFESNPGFGDAVRLRSWDDGGKVEGLDVRDLDAYLPMLRSVSLRR
ncbi:MAG: phosphohydrolase [Actinomycetota bacterium]|nr:phosphohydrolase [Actinomycetota bacterium]